MAVVNFKATIPTGVQVIEGLIGKKKPFAISDIQHRSTNLDGIVFVESLTWGYPTSKWPSPSFSQSRGEFGQLGTSIGKDHKLFWVNKPTNLAGHKRFKVFWRLVVRQEKS